MFKLVGFNEAGKCVLDTFPDSFEAALMGMELEVYSFGNPFGVVVFKVLDFEGLILRREVR